jgi:hypothetical protein
MSITILNDKNDYSLVGQDNNETNNQYILFTKIISLILLFLIALLFGTFPYFW